MKLKIKTVQHKLESEKQLVSMNAVGGSLVSKPLILIPASMLQLVKLSFNLKWTRMKFIGSKQQCLGLEKIWRSWYWSWDPESWSWQKSLIYITAFNGLIWNAMKRPTCQETWQKTSVTDFFTLPKFGQVSDHVLTRPWTRLKSGRVHGLATSRYPWTGWKLTLMITGNALVKWICLKLNIK